MFDRSGSAADKHLLYHELLERLRQPGCAVCGLSAAAAAQHLDSLCGECVTDPRARQRWQESLGLCAPHSAQFDALAPRLTVAILYEDLLRQMERELEGWTRARRRPPPAARCAACAASAQSEERS
ncbi:MAG TPA: hypothetical protein VK689_18565, partial [Armatimonadota bacterium]|nr:hypothetical protein [Armatimonadota bacterium]